MKSTKYRNWGLSGSSALEFGGAKNAQDQMHKQGDRISLGLSVYALST